MLRWFLLVLIFTLSLQALGESEILKRADSLMKTQNTSDEFRAYNDYKNLYLQAIMSEDEKLKNSALQGIVKSGNRLHIDVSQYLDELSSLKPHSSYNKPKSKNIATQNENITIRASHKLQSVRWEDDRLVLKFDNELSSNQINYFTLCDPETKKYKYVFDIHASMLTESQSLRKDGISRIKLAQYDPQTLRLVIEDSEKIKVRFKKESDQLVINLEAAPKKKTTYVKNEIKSSLSSQKRADRNRVIMIDAGHGGKDPGALGYKNYREKIVVLQIAKQLKSILNSRGYKVYMSRDKDIFIKLSNRTEYANTHNADIFISIHANAVEKNKADEACGIECYFLSPSRSEKAEKIAAKENSADMSDMNSYGKQSFLSFLNNHKILASNKLAIDMQRGMLSSLNRSYKDVVDGGVREGPFWVLVGAQMPSVLVEVGFISHPREARRLVDSKYQKELVLGMADGIERYFANN
ncbi:MAG: N-acetylmuramoyl-L-alanine amidase [Helicobacteraceae bacterium CG2_30_36_10]|nr:MAG: N-acetylmuramoyl-L-alanine amidase [Helicobacteraceae bacterium CG2_30_36_10]